MNAQEIIQHVADELKAIVEVKEANGDFLSKQEIQHIVRMCLDVRHKSGEMLTEYGRQSVVAVMEQQI